MNYKKLLYKYMDAVNECEGITPEMLFNLDSINWKNVKEGEITKEEAEELVNIWKHGNG